MSEKPLEQLERTSLNSRRSIDSILCPTSLSPASDEALRYAVGLARVYNAKLLLCYVSENPQELTPEQVNKFFIDSIGPYISETDRPWLKWEGFIVKGEPEEVIPDLAAKHNVDLIVMRSRRRPYAAMLLGSTTEAVCHRAPCPVLVTHRQERSWVNLDGEVQLKRVLVAYDFSKYSDLALSYGLSLAQEFQTELHLMNVCSDNSEISEDEKTKALTHLRELLPSEVSLWAKIVPVVASGKPYHQVLDYIKENQIDLVCMGAHGAGHTPWALFGSNVDRVLRQAICPILVAHFSEPEEK